MTIASTDMPLSAAPDHREGNGSISAIYPLHVILSAYPIACFTGAFMTDWVYVASQEMQWANFSAWLIVAGLVMGVLAGIAGLVDFIANRKAWRQRAGWLHGLGNGVVMLMALINAFIHSRDAYTSVMPWGLFLSALVMVLVLATSWLGARQTAQAHWRNSGEEIAA